MRVVFSRGNARIGWLFIVCLALSAALAGTSFSEQARAFDLVVKSNADSGPNTLRAAVRAASNNDQPDTIFFDLPENRPTITLKDPITFSDGTTVVDGGDRVTVNGDDKTNIFVVTDGDVTFRDIALEDGYEGIHFFGKTCGAALTVRGGATVKVVSSDISANRARYGGGIYNSMRANLTVDSSTISLNDAEVNGGGILNLGKLTVRSSTISDNSADGGGGIFTAGGGFPGDRTMIVNSTIARNTAFEVGSGIYNGDGVTDISYSTIAGNRSPSEGVFGVQIRSFVRTEFIGSIVAGNYGSDDSADVGLAYGFGDRPLYSGGGNVIGVGQSKFFTNRGDRTGQTLEQAFGTDRLSLMENGGPTKTIALKLGSVAIDNVPKDTKGVPPTDQRGVKRPEGGPSDSGAFELKSEAGSGSDERCTITGTSGDDVLRGTPGRDVICGLSGSDRIEGLGGDDILRGGSGDDVLEGGRGNDALQGEEGSDVLVGGPGRDRLDGGGGTNSLRQ